MESTMNSFIESLCIANESDLSFTEAMIGKLKQLIISCKHIITRLLYQIRTIRKIEVPKEIDTCIKEVSSECVRIHAKNINHNSEINVSNKISVLRSSITYKMVFGGVSRDYSEKDYISIDTKKLSNTLRSLDKELEHFEKELLNISELRTPSNFSFNEISGSILILSEYIKVQSQYFNWLKPKSVVDDKNSVDLGESINIILDEPSI
jgi:hypothetical protein